MNDKPNAHQENPAETVVQPETEATSEDITAEPEQAQQSTGETEANADSAEDASAADSSQQAENSDYEQLQKQIVMLHADLENIRRRHAQELSKAHTYGLEKCMRELLPVIDSLEMALVSVSEGDRENNDLYTGVSLTQQMLVKALQTFGLSTVQPERGVHFDPQKHEAMTTQPQPDLPANAVVQTIQSGYTLGDRLLRPARVIVAAAGKNE